MSSMAGPVIRHGREMVCWHLDGNHGGRLLETRMLKRYVEEDGGGRARRRRRGDRENGEREAVKGKEVRMGVLAQAQPLFIILPRPRLRRRLNSN